MQCVLADRETEVIEPSRLNIVAQSLSTFLLRSLPCPLIHTSLSLSLVGSDQAASKRAGGVHYEKEKGCATSTVQLHTHRQASLTVTHYTYPTPETGYCSLGQPVRHASALVRELGMWHLAKKWKWKWKWSFLFKTIVSARRTTRYKGKKKR